MSLKNYLAIFILFTTSASFSQTKKSSIDKLETKKEVQRFIEPFNEGAFYDFKVTEISKFRINRPRYRRIGKNTPFHKTADSLGVSEPFYKVDFDNNGLTDILVIGKTRCFKVFVVMDFGEDSLKFIDLIREAPIFGKCVVPQIIKSNAHTLINYHTQQRNWKNSKPDFILNKSLIFKFGGFVELNENPKTYNIEKIEYKTRAGFLASQFSIKIDKSQNASFDAQACNTKRKYGRYGARKGEEMKGQFEVKIKNDDYDQIIGLLNYIDFPNLKDDYISGGIDSRTSTLTITYDNGTLKKIHDLGSQGSFGLARFYDLMFELRFNQAWKQKL